ncbi:MAG: TIGR01440 family protein [Eubacteriales bacterium]|nr:TIGR01440 family protein [Eubacteriales bacterium]
MNFELISAQAREAFEILMDTAKPKAGQLLVLGCSTSEIMGKRIGSCSTTEAAKAVYGAIAPLAAARGLCFAVQGCEHINRSLCVSSGTMEKFELQQVWVKPHLHAGGACITEAFCNMPDAVMVEDLRAKATLAIDIGDTIIGMHLHPVAVPVHSSLRKIGEANLVLAYSRPKYVGGPRAEYLEIGNPHK